MKEKHKDFSHKYILEPLLMFLSRNVIVFFSFIFLSFFLIIPFVYISNDIPLPFQLSPQKPPIPQPPPSPSPLPLWGCSLSHPPLQYPAMLGHKTSTGPRASPPIDVQQVHSHRHIRLEPWVPPCVLLGWWFSPWELWVVLLVDIVLPMGLQSPSAPSVLPLTLPLGSQAQSNGWLYLHLRI